MTNCNGAGLLLVEDDGNDVLLIQRAFRQANLSIPLTMVEDGDEAIAYLTGQGQYADRATYPLPSLILLDLKLPRRSGLEVLEWLRGQTGLRRIPVVVLTASREHADVDRAYEIGANSYLVKPVSFDSLTATISALNQYWLQLNQYPSVQPA
ncbi:response regulator [Romeria aff. gracilis LEGE 07310]|uniref:Response regulator n=1 Tax=Vasconcelosia minhoensis LEGE 07310 TaxID=915328 RepID=A0A8J7B133_9CYAN|nr:response regulator [Romeria gracilis]MBE9080397.1 response regulator [Romeria aff. gracilis LEGE 07310]